jgi:hypothetical protein
MAICTPLGLPLYFVTDNPGMLGVGVAIGVAIGAAMEEKYNKNPRPLTGQEKKNRKIAVVAGGLTFVAGLIVLILGLMAAI